MRYGENPHQAAAAFQIPGDKSNSIFNVDHWLSMEPLSKKDPNSMEHPGKYKYININI